MVADRLCRKRCLSTRTTCERRGTNGVHCGEMKNKSARERPHGRNILTSAKYCIRCSWQIPNIRPRISNVTRDPHQRPAYRLAGRAEHCNATCRTEAISRLHTIQQIEHRLYCRVFSDDDQGVSTLGHFLDSSFVALSEINCMGTVMRQCFSSTERLVFFLQSLKEDEGTRITPSFLSLTCSTCPSTPICFGNTASNTGTVAQSGSAEGSQLFLPGCEDYK